MSKPSSFAGDLSGLPTHAFGARSLTWWGVIAYMLIEGTAFALAGASYLFLMSQEQNWPPARLPDLLAGTLFTVVILLSELPNIILKKAAEKEDLAQVRRWLIILDLIGLLLLVIRGFEFQMINVRWNDNAYGSIAWALLLLHTVHILTDWVDSAVLTALMFTPHGKGRRFVDVSEDCLYWRFVWLTWLPIYLLLYWAPRVA
ncbi:MAG TPA: cytochrome c oxidase subunit 3 [Sphingomonadaceae bacterium]|jgi:heme/copper-type cytochrome/quinol oxidase subunit 3|nr:cytochrome c oxidase subunit 3 [Sphingomonadaceae bacterium]